MTHQDSFLPPSDILSAACLETPIGYLMLVSGIHGLKKLFHHPCKSHSALSAQLSDTEKLPLHWKPWLERFPQNDVVSEACHQLTEYFVHKRTAFDLPLDLSFGTPFQQTVWKALQDIPFGESVSYKALARTLGNENKIRAVGTANGRNPLPLFLPCHRVIGSDGALTGFAWGLDVKEKLLRHEGNKYYQTRQLTLEMPEK